MKRPWNRDALSVFSLLTYSKNGDLNMNVCTYVSIVNMHPKTYAISIEYSSLTYKNIIQNSSNVVLQRLSKKNINLVKHIGKKTGFIFNKKKFLKENDLLIKWRNHYALRDTSYLIELRYLEKYFKLKDHCLFFFKINSYKNQKNELLTLTDLIDKKIIL